jgi:hypothetical protein
MHTRGIIPGRGGGQHVRGGLGEARHTHSWRTMCVAQRACSSAARLNPSLGAPMPINEGWRSVRNTPSARSEEASTCTCL